MSLRHAIRTRSFALTAELPPTADRDALLEQADRLREAVDAVQVTDNPGSRPYLSGLAAAAVLRMAGHAPVMQLSCRDRNRIALQSELLGAAALGVSELVIMRGRSLVAGRRGAAKAVFDIGATELLANARAMRAGTSLVAAARNPDFFLGASATVLDPGEDWRPRTLRAKADAGAQFLQTQPCFDMPVLRRYLKALVSARLTQRVHVLVGVAPLPNVATARWLRDHRRESRVPEEIIRRLEQSPDPEYTGVEICAETLHELAEIPGVSGACLVTLGDPDTVVAAIAASGLRAAPKAAGTS